MYLPEFQAAGRTLLDSGLITGASGNLSIRVKDHLIITRHGSILSALVSSGLVQTGIYADDSATSLASCELPVHRAIYIGTSALAIVHAHPPCAVTLSVRKTNSELPGGVVVVGTSTGIVAGVLAGEIACELKKHPMVMVKGHGSFAIGKTLKEACALTTGFEENCKRTCLRHSVLVKPVNE